MGIQKQDIQKLEISEIQTYTCPCFQMASALYLVGPLDFLPGIQMIVFKIW